MKNLKLVIGLVALGFMTVSFMNPSIADENYCLAQEGSGAQGYCEEQLLEDGNGTTINWCVGADMGAPNTSNKSKCIGNAMEPY